MSSHVPGLLKKCPIRDRRATRELLMNSDSFLVHLRVRGASRDTLYWHQPETLSMCVILAVAPAHDRRDKEEMHKAHRKGEGANERDTVT